MLHFFWGSWGLTSSSRFNKDSAFPPPHLLCRERQTKTCVTKDSSKLFSNLCLKKMTPNAVIMVMPRGSVRSGLYFAKCCVKYQMVPILKSRLSWETRRMKVCVERAELHLSADKAVVITALLSGGLWSIPHSAAASSHPPASHNYDFRRVGASACVCEVVATALPQLPRGRLED